ncbi:L,D-transpeptidase family protein [Microbacterium sp. M28]|uniref:L,D-transpeptidase family protein n=1 Tax=Microbacterium sp. M28 TaxID=2962064 RepID=UPI0021F46BD2|nr:L,D-transpeptidase family protein [Microbacterium sp. M28]UYO96270.1 L,D-transpeptidase family protein [Microbacterium sp. M28]
MPITGGEIVTDLVAASGSDTAKTAVISESDATSAARNAEQPPENPHVEWAPIESAPRKKRIGLWVGIGAGVVVLGAAAASMVLIAPGTSVAGIQVGGMTPGMAAETISNRLAETEVTLTGMGGDVVVTGADLGASVDATALAEQAFAERPLWNVSQWGADPISASIALDAETAESTLRSAAPASFTDATDATVVFDGASGTYTVTPAESGSGIDVDALSGAFVEAIGDGKSSLEFTGDPTEALPDVSTEDAEATASELNTMLAGIGFYVGEERTVPVGPAVAATWLSVENVDGELVVEADAAAIQTTVDGLAAAVDRAPVNAKNVTDGSGNVLRELTAGQNGRALGDTSGIAEDFAAQLTDGNAVYALQVTETPFETTALVRRAEVDLSSQRAYFYENDQLVNSWAISSGRPGHETETGKFKIRAHVRIQDMGGASAGYLTKDVPWVTYFNGDQAFHGTYWHSNFGSVMSHGCVNMPISAAQWVYEWAPDGVEVHVHN